MIDEMTIRERALAAIRHQPVDCIPFLDLGVDAGVAAAATGGRENLISDPRTEKLLESNNPLEQSLGDVQLKKDISRTFWLHNINWWNCMWPFPTPEGPKDCLLNPEQKNRGASADGLIKTIYDIDHIEFVKKDAAFWDRAKIFIDNKGDYAACGMIWLGIDPVWRSMGFETFATTLLLEPEIVEHFMDRLTDWLAEAVAEMCRIGFDFIWAADDIAFNTQPFFSPKSYRKHLLPYTRKVANEITLPWIYHSDGNILPLLDDLLSQEMNAIHPLEDGSMDLDLLKSRWGGKTTLVGNINLNTLGLGTTEQVQQEVKDRIAQLGPDYGYILSSGNSVAKYCKAENVLTMIDTLKKFGRYPLIHEKSIVP